MHNKELDKQKKIWAKKLKESGFVDIELNSSTGKNDLDGYTNQKTRGLYNDQNEKHQLDVVRDGFEKAFFFNTVLDFINNKLVLYLDHSTHKNKNKQLYRLVAVMFYKGFTLRKMMSFLEEEYKIEKSIGTIHNIINELYKMFEADTLFHSCPILYLDNNKHGLSKEPWDVCSCCGRKYLIEFEEKSTYDLCAKCIHIDLN